MNTLIVPNIERKRNNSNKNNSYINEIKERIDIVEIAEEEGIHLLKRGRSIKAYCPFHSERTASFSINTQKQIFKCFGCGVGGDAISLLARMRGISNKEAVRVLAVQLGMDKPLTEELKREYAKKKEDKELEKRFLAQYNEIFKELCSIRDIMVCLAKQYSHYFIDTLVNDDLLQMYYQEQGYHEHLIEGMLAGLLEEIGFDKQIQLYSEAKGVVERWGGHLQKRLV